jgi:glycerol uptake facilitator-like aquaporin
MGWQQWAIIVLSYAILTSGVAQLVVSGIAISDSSAFGAAWYTGLSCIFAGAQGIRLGPKQDLSRRFVKWIFASALFSSGRFCFHWIPVLNDFD